MTAPESEPKQEPKRAPLSEPEPLSPCLPQGSVDVTMPPSTWCPMPPPRLTRAEARCPAGRSGGASCRAPGPKPQLPLSSLPGPWPSHPYSLCSWGAPADHAAAPPRLALRRSLAPSSPLAVGSCASRQRRRQQSSAAQEEEEVAGRAQRERSVIGTLSRASPRATAHVECGLAHGAAVAAPPWRLLAWSPWTHEQKERRLFEPLSSPALQNQLQVFAGPVRQKTVSVSARK